MPQNPSPPPVQRTPSAGRRLIQALQNRRPDLDLRPHYQELTESSTYKGRSTTTRPSIVRRVSQVLVTLTSTNKPDHDDLSHTLLPSPSDSAPTTNPSPKKGLPRKRSRRREIIAQLTSAGNFSRFRRSEHSLVSRRASCSSAYSMEVPSMVDTVEDEKPATDIVLKRPQPEEYRDFIGNPFD